MWHTVCNKDGTESKSTSQFRIGVPWGGYGFPIKFWFAIYSKSGCHLHASEKYMFTYIMYEHLNTSPPPSQFLQLFYLPLPGSDLGHCQK